MKRALHQAIVFFALLLLVTLVRMPFGSYRESLLPQLRSHLTPLGVVIDFADLTLSPPSRLFLDRLNILFRVNHFPVPLQVDNAELDLNPWALFRLNASGRGNAHLYQGTLDYELARPLLGERVTMNGTLKSLSLAAHPLLGSFGLSGTVEGKFSGEFVADSRGALVPERGELYATLGNGMFRGGVKVMGLVAIPEIKEISLVTQANLEPGLLVLTSISASTSMGTFSGKGRLRRRDLVHFGEGKIAGTLHLTDEGKKTFGGYLALAAHTDIAHPATDWELTVNFDARGYPVASVAAAS